MGLLTNLTLGTATPKLLNVNTALDGSAVEMTDGANNGSGVYLDGANERVGIGVASPTHKLSVAGGIKMGSTVATADYNAHTVILSDGGTAYEGGLLMTQMDTASAGNSSIKFNVTSSGATGNANLHIGVVDNNAPNTFIRQHMHLDGSTGNVSFQSGGKVGIGTGVPNSPLEVVSDTNTQTYGALMLRDSGSGNHSNVRQEFTPFSSDSVPASGYMDVEVGNTGGWLFINTSAGGYGMFYLYMNDSGSASTPIVASASSSEITIAGNPTGGTDYKFRITNGDSGNAVQFRGLFISSLGKFKITTISS